MTEAAIPPETSQPASLAAVSSGSVKNLKRRGRAREIAQELRAHTALAKDKFDVRDPQKAAHGRLSLPT